MEAEQQEGEVGGGLGGEAVVLEAHVIAQGVGGFPAVAERSETDCREAARRVNARAFINGGLATMASKLGFLAGFSSRSVAPAGWLVSQSVSLRSAPPVREGSRRIWR